MEFTLREIEVLLEALKGRAAWHETQARHRPHLAKRHNEMAAEMRKLQQRFLKLKVGRQ
jgi:hypothetical protein